MEENLINRKLFYFVGIGGIGMSALARYVHAKGAAVFGYDRVSTALTTEMELSGMDIHYDDSVTEIPSILLHSDKDDVLVVYTPAIPPDHKEFNWLRNRGYRCVKRSELLGAITAHTRCLGIAGTHGKTTTSSLLAHLLKDSGVGCNAFLGGIAANYQSNLILTPESSLTVVEADEFDRSFLTLSPTCGVITSMDSDHLDIYGDAGHVRESFCAYARRIKDGGLLLLRRGLTLDDSFAGEKPDVRVMTYSVDQPDADYYACNLIIEDGKYTFSLRGPDLHLDHLVLGLPGRHNVENAVAASALATICGVSGEQLRAGLANFRGVHRRFELIADTGKVVYIDDYAHHPAELEACIRSARELYPGKTITGVFQPHLFSRTRDFADEFGRALSLLDHILLLPIYPARELPIAGVDSQMLLDKIPHLSKKLVEKDELLEELRSMDSGVILTMGAGDIDMLVRPIREML